MVREQADSLASKCSNTTVRETVANPTWLKTFEQQQGLVTVRPQKSTLDTNKSDPSSQISSNPELVLASALHTPTVLPPIISFTGSSPSVPPPSHCGENRKNHQTDNCPHLNDTILTSLSSSPYSAGEVNSKFAQISDVYLSPSENPLLLPDTYLDALLDQTSLSTTIDPKLIFTEHQQEQDITGQHPGSPEVALPGPPSPNLRRPIMFHNNAPVGSANTPQYIWRSTKSSCLSHHSQSGTAVSTKPASSPTLDEAQAALETAVNYFQKQQMRLDPSEWVLLGRLMERLNRTKGQTSRGPVDCDGSA